MKNRFLTKAMFAAILTVGVFTACNDDFSEKDFLEKQYELADQMSAKEHAQRLAELAAAAENAQELAKLNEQLQEQLAQFNSDLTDTNNQKALEAYQEAGLVVDANIQVIDHVTDKPIADATVSLGGVSGTTDSVGAIKLENVPIGYSSLEVSATDYYAAQSFTSITFNPQPAVNGLYVKRNVTVEYKLISSSSSLAENTVEIEGEVSIDSDLTNPVTEIPTAAKVKADFTGFVGSGSTTGITVKGYSLPSFPDADVDPTTGMYKIVVPALNGVKVYIPEYEQGIKYISENPDFDFSKPEDENTNPRYLLNDGVDAVFKDNFSNASYAYQHSSSTRYPNFYTYKTEEPEGSGLELKFTPVSGNSYNFTTYYVNGDRSHYNFDGGLGYTGYPTATITAAADGSMVNDDVVETRMVDSYNSVTIKASDLDLANMVVGTNYTIALSYRVFTDATTYSDYFKDSFTAQKLASGDVTFTYLGNVYTNEFSIYNVRIFSYANAYTSAGELYLQDFGSILTKTKLSTYETPVRAVYSARISTPFPGTAGNYLSAPTITFSGGGATQQAALTIFSSGASNLYQVEVTNGGDYEYIPLLRDADGNTLDIYVQTGANSYNYVGSSLSNMSIKSDASLALNNPRYSSRVQPGQKAYVYASDIAKLEGFEEDIPSSYTRASRIDFYIDGATQYFNLSSTRFTYRNNNNYFRFKTPQKVEFSKRYSWVPDAMMPTEVELTHYNNTNIISFVNVVKYGEGYMRVRHQTSTSYEYIVSPSLAGQKVTRNFSYGTGELK